MSISLDTLAVRRRFTRTFLGGMAFYTFAIFALSCWLGWQPPVTYAHIWSLPLWGVFPLWATMTGISTPIVNFYYR